MRVLIVETSQALSRLWTDHLERIGFACDIAHTQADAVSHLAVQKYNVVVLNLVLKNGSALAVSDYANYRWPHARVVFVTNSSFFSDGSIFNHSSNACAFVPQGTEPDDLAAIVDYHAAN